MKIKLGIFGYGNIGKGVETAVKNTGDLEVTAIFTRRNPSTIKSISGAPVYSADDVLSFKNKIDVLILCGGSATDLPVQAPALAKDFNVIDTFDNHSKIPEHFKNVNDSALKNNTVAIISTGWDPGLFSLNRIYAEAIIPNGQTYTFWGKGVSQGHSDAIRRVKGVKDAKQYTIPIEQALQTARSGKRVELTARQKHIRECFVVAFEGEDLERIENEIKTMPAYFADYDTIVHFISQEELDKNHSKIPHGGFVIRTGNSSQENNHVIEYNLKLDSNPEFTSSVVVAYARAAYRLKQNGDFGAKTVFDVAPCLLSEKSADELLKTLL